VSQVNSFRHLFGEHKKQKSYKPCHEELTLRGGTTFSTKSFGKEVTEATLGEGGLYAFVGRGGGGPYAGAGAGGG
jgi:hypothetical protein